MARVGVIRTETVDAFADGIKGLEADLGALTPCNRRG